MLNKIANGYGRSKAMAEYVKEAERMIEKYGWQERTVMPYGFPEKVSGMILDFKGFDNYTAMSKDQLVLEANGLADILNAWEACALAPKTKVLTKDGKELELTDEELEMFREYVEVI